MKDTEDFRVMCILHERILKYKVSPANSTPIRYTNTRGKAI